MGVSLPAPQAPANDRRARAADAEGFAQWRLAPNYRRTSDRRNVFVAAVREALEDRRVATPGQQMTALDIGCGWGISEDPHCREALLHDIREAADQLIGIEPDPAVRPAHGLFSQLLHATMEEADLPPASVDVAYAYYVLEHVADPHRFMQAVARVLRPGGIFVAMTPNGRHWFSRASRLLGALHLDGMALRLLRGARAANAYHYPVVHRLNDLSSVRRHAEAVGFTSVEVASFDHGDLLPYLPPLVRPLYDRWSGMVEGGGRRDLICLLVRMQRGVS